MTDLEFWEEGPSHAASWRENERSSRAYAAFLRRMRWVPVAIGVGGISAAVALGPSMPGYALMGFSFVPIILGAFEWQGRTAYATKVQRDAEECAAIASDLEVGLMPPTWADGGVFTREPMWWAERERGE